MADATGGQKLSLMKSTTTTTDSNIVGGSERYLAAAVARLDCDGALIDSIQARPPKEEVGACVTILWDEGMLLEWSLL